MGKARKDIIREDGPALYSINSRCVRRAWLLGVDPLTGRDHSHRMKWVEDSLRFLVGIFSVQVQSYAVMDDHFHLVLRVDPLAPQSWSAEEVARRWCTLYPPKCPRSGEPVELTPEFLRRYIADPAKEKSLRRRLGNLSSFMGVHNERLARRANAEDKCTGRFWQGRFYATHLGDFGAILTAMMYADLNPIRATKAQTPEQSDHTSVQDRIIGRQGRRKLALLGESTGPAPIDQATKAGQPASPEPPPSPPVNEFPTDPSSPNGLATTENPSPSRQPEENASAVVAETDRAMPPISTAERDLQLAVAHREAHRDAWLRPFSESPEQDPVACLPISLDRYLELVDYAGRMIRENKRGAIPAHLAPILQRLDLDLENWLDNVQHFRRRFFRMAGKVEYLVEAARTAGLKWFRGHAAAAQLYRCVPARI